MNRLAFVKTLIFLFFVAGVLYIGGRSVLAGHDYGSHSCGNDGRIECWNGTCDFCNWGEYNGACHFCCNPNAPPGDPTRCDGGGGDDDDQGGGGGGGGGCDSNSWGGWSGCSASCGGGTQERFNDCGERQEQSCNTQSCCNANNWGGWSACSASCGGGTQSRTNECGSTQTQSCNTQSCCTPSSPSGGLTLTYPSNGATGVISPVGFQWGGVASWGTNCSGNNNSYKVYVKESAVSSCPSSGYSQVCDTSSTSCSSSLAEGKSYCWYVNASNGSLSTESAKAFFKMNYNLQGFIWDASGKACSADKRSNELQEGDVEGDIVPSISGGPTGNWDPSSYSDFSYSIGGVPDGDQVVCASPTPKDKPGFRYTLGCLNDGSSGVVSGSCASVNINESPETAHLGYTLHSKGWFASVGGDVYGGNAGTSVSQGIPSAADILGGFKQYLIQGLGTLFGNGDLSVKDPDGNSRYSEDGNRNVRFTQYTDNWPIQYDFTPPQSADEISDCESFLKNSKLDPSKSYKVSSSCVQDGIDSLGGGEYKLGGDGVVVVYVTGSDEITFGVGNKEFRSKSDAQRILFVVEGSVAVSKDLGAATISLSDRPQIESAFVSSGNVSFESAGDVDGDLIPDDLSVVVEGPIISKTGIDFNRDRGINNGYPSSVVKYSTIYIDKLREQEAKSDSPNYSGLSVVDISWTQ